MAMEKESIILAHTMQLSVRTDMATIAIDAGTAVADITGRQ